jgi:uncharacterized protein YndB with AHSA1/START domain
MEKQAEYVKELTLSRLFDAPRERVWAAWTDPEILSQWWVPQGMTAPVCELDVRPGGRLLIHLSGYGRINPFKGVFGEVVQRERLVFTNDGYESVEAAEPVTRSITTVTLKEADGKTELMVHTGVVWTTAEAAKYLNGMEATWTGYLDNLAGTLSAS